MERCPVCRSRLRGANLCGRCGTDLALPLAIAAKAEHALARAVRCIADGEVDAARVHVREAQSLQRTPLARALWGFVGQLAEEESRPHQGEDASEELAPEEPECPPQPPITWG